ncbi:MAG: hypothetical protein IPH20_19920 [Bacteroidales bacterium]|nr:hypothetical protein [Bacteroidales bacterium]
MDFTIIIYQQLLNTLLSQGFSFITVATYAEAKTEVKVKVKVEPTWLTNQSDMSNSFSQSDRVEGILLSFSLNFLFKLSLFFLNLNLNLFLLLNLNLNLNLFFLLNLNLVTLSGVEALNLLSSSVTMWKQSTAMR